MKFFIRCEDRKKTKQQIKTPTLHCCKAGLRDPAGREENLTKLFSHFISQHYQIPPASIRGIFKVKVINFFITIVRLFFIPKQILYAFSTSRSKLGELPETFSAFVNHYILTKK